MWPCAFALMMPSVLALRRSSAYLLVHCKQFQNTIQIGQGHHRSLWAAIHHVEKVSSYLLLHLTRRDGSQLGSMRITNVAEALGL